METERNVCTGRVRYLVTKHTNSSCIQLTFVDDRVVNREILSFGAASFGGAIYFKTCPIVLVNRVVTFRIIYKDLYNFYL